MKTQKKQSDCGCVISQDRYGILSLEYCPKHKTAPDMYEILNKVRQHFGHTIITYEESQLVNAIDEVLAKIEGGN